MIPDGNKVDQVVEKTPWWVISSFLHLALLMVAGLFFGIQAMAQEDEVVVVSPSRKKVTLPEMERPKIEQISKKLIEHTEQEEDPIIKDAIDSDHPESIDDDTVHQMEGKSLDFNSKNPFKDKAAGDLIGGGATGGGRFGYPRGGSRELTVKGGGDNRTEKAVLAALRWLARHQNLDGSWKVTGYHEECNQVAKYASGPRCVDTPGDASHDTGVTGLSLLAFLGAGFSYQSSERYDGINFGDVVKKGLQWLISQQDPDGLVGGRVGERWMYNHLIATLALTEAYGRTGGGVLIQNAAEKALAYTVQAKNPGAAWRYTYRPGDNDSSITGWGAMVLKSAAMANLGSPVAGVSSNVLDWFDEVTSRKGYYDVGYTYADSGKTFEPGRNERFQYHPSMAAVASMSRMFLEKNRRSPAVVGGCNLLIRDLPEWEKDKIDYYYWYYGSLALFQFGGAHWEKWNAAMKEALLPHQNGEDSGCQSGSWDPVGRWSHAGTRVYATAINALTLEVYYRYTNVFTGR